MSTYLDHAATTPVRPEAVDAMLPFFTVDYGNPSGAHLMARTARRAVDDARDIVAEALGARPADLVFTSGGTEADNMAIFGAVRRHGGVAVCSAIEHHAVLHPVEALHGRIVGVDARGIVDLDALAQALDDTVTIVSVMLANNESGVVQPIREVAAVVRRAAPRALLHTDAVNAFMWVDVATECADVDLITISAHKFGGPKGVGALVVRNGASLEPLLLGGGQEHDRRSGTHNVAGIVGMATAARATVESRAETIARVAVLRDRLADGLRGAVDDTYESGVSGIGDGRDRSHKVAGNCHLCFSHIESEALLFLLEKEGVLASAASSCASGAQDPSHVLAAMGVDRHLAQGSLRLTLGYSSTAADVDLALDAVPAAVARLRRFG
ncbi:MAG TPA: cysteine desulfurase family protein [Acidimicrobiales bacterium]|nr:cysteine desulfurase family protein [Acidimicrobiales bacterium]